MPVSDSGHDDTLQVSHDVLPPLRLLGSLLGDQWLKVARLNRRQYRTIPNALEVIGDVVDHRLAELAKLLGRRHGRCGDLETQVGVANRVVLSCRLPVPYLSPLRNVEVTQTNRNIQSQVSILEGGSFSITIIMEEYSPLMASVLLSLHLFRHMFVLIMRILA